MSIATPILGTAIIGAGPAGLLFAAFGRRRWEQAGHRPEEWALAIYDERPIYSRTHRLRLDPRPYAHLVQQANDPRFTTLGEFLERECHTPNIADLERELERLAASFGVVKEVIEVGPGVEHVGLAELRSRVLGPEAAPETHFTIVGADSVHSAVREAVQTRAARSVTHEHLARVVVRGPGLPRHLSVLETYRLSKVVASIFDYRCRVSSRAEIDLFLTARAFEAFAKLGASPRNPVGLNPKLVGHINDPLLRRFLGFLSQGFGAGPCTLELASVFRLEHAIASSCALRPEGLNGAAIFLVGDAAVSLPFQRGMSCLARSVGVLADAHLAIAGGAGDKALIDYDAALRAIIQNELKVVRARAVLVGGMRQFVRISAMLPFPIQNWFLSVDGGERVAGRLTPGLGLNALLAVATGVVSLGAPMFSLFGGTTSLAPAFGIVFGAAGGLVYRATLTFEPLPNGWVRGVWRWTILIVFVGGVGLAVTTSVLDGRPRQLGLLALWWLVGIGFVLGIALFEWIGRRSFAVGRFDDG